MPLQLFFGGSLIVRTEKYRVWGQGIRACDCAVSQDVCDLFFACPCSDRHSLITAAEILPWSWKCHGSKMTPTTFYLHLLTFTNFSGFAMPAYWDLLTLEEQNYLRKFSFYCLFFKCFIQNKLHSSKKRGKLCIASLEMEWWQKLTNYRNKHRKYRPGNPLMLIAWSLWAAEVRW